MKIHISVLVNSLSVAAGSSVGMILGKSIPDRLRKVLFQAVGLTTIGIGIKMTLETSDFIVVLISLALGVLFGELLRIEDRIASIGKISRDSNRFAKGFVTATTLFLVGPMTIVGSVRAGLIKDGTLIYIKSVLDFISSIILASLYGIGVLVTSLIVLLIQGLLVIFSSQLVFLTDKAYLADFTGAGGLIVVAIGIRLLEIEDIRVGNFLPALVFTPIVDFLARMIAK
ncbi:MAG TPA: DUF554 domain-containing protein [Pseudothermotoga sp.]|nr:DUF554 domain-containing protein [Pseudothermotoga sp.]HOK83629.1 DUF554 domain-containing protein [Pseudothermotoga sp.]HPP69268.1 DUF554 domain-containing protein [Pseudothermotoga sp.]